MKYFTDTIVEGHFEYLDSKGFLPQHMQAAYLTFSYEPPYQSALDGDEFWHTEKLTGEEIKQFEKCFLDSHYKYWERLENRKNRESNAS